MSEINEQELNEVSGGNDGMYGPYFSYTVQPGDCLSVIAVRFHTTVNELCRLNNIPNPDKIRAYSELLIPKKY